MPAPRQPQVSMSFFLPHIDSTDIIEAERAHLGPLRAAFSPSLEGVKNWKNLNCTQSRHTIVSPFWAFVLVGVPATNTAWCIYEGSGSCFTFACFFLTLTKYYSLLLLHRIWSRTLCRGRLTAAHRMLCM
jgi:hypothetical protein